MDILNSLITDFSIKNLTTFFRGAIPSFKADDEEFDHLFSDDIYDKYESIAKIGDAKIDKDDLIVIASKTSDPLTERTGKRNQYEIAKAILKHEVKDASLFVFYDEEGNFRFSFIRANYRGTKRDFSDFKRYTYFVSPSQTNRTFIKQVGGCNFNSLDEIVEAFSVEPLNKQFYQAIAKSFYNLIGGKVKMGSKNEEYEASLKLPSTSIETNRKIYQEFGVRLIGRTIFCWFLKNKKSDAGIPLIPDDWVSSIAVNENYYHSILEKLFFLVLNKKQEDRKESFLLPDNHTQIPFLNGGLFEPHLEDYFKNNKANYGLKLPDDWFKNLFKTLEQYNFTIDENSIYDSEVSIDPEMLGTIFENLLAEIDPDTEKSARKATGSFYTPREIVDYMVEQSLVQYLKTKIETDKEEQLLELFKEGGENKFEENQTKQILEALSDVKILDPACGSGAFPMGALHKIIIALQKLDPDASWWKQKQLEKIDNAIVKRHLKTKLDVSSSDYARKLGVIQHSIYGVDIQPIAAEISKLRSFLSLVIDENIDDDAVNRGVEPLPNLEFKFVTANTLIGLEAKSNKLDLDQKDELQDRLKTIRSQYLQAYGEDKAKLKQDFEDIQLEIYKRDAGVIGNRSALLSRLKYLKGYQKDNKADLTKEIKTTQNKIDKLEKHVANERAEQLASWKPFSNESSSWFDPEWMFGVEKFDVVIGNPPYGVSVKGDFRKTVLSQLDKVPDYEIYYFFLEVSKNFIDKNGITAYIIPNTFLFNVYAEKYRTKMLQDWKCFIIDCTAFKIFDKATVSNAIVVLENNFSEKVKYFKTDGKDSFDQLINQEVSFVGIDELKEYKQNWGLAFKLDKNIIELTTKIRKASIPLINLFPEISQGLIAYDKYKGQDEETIKNRIYHFDNFSKPSLKRWLWGEDVTKYSLMWNKSEWIDYCDGIANPRNPDFFIGERVLIREITNPSIFAAITEEEYYHDPALIIVKKSKTYSSKVLLAVLNSSLATFFHFNYSPKATKGAFPKIIVEDIRNFPLPKVNSDNVEMIESIVNIIIDEHKSKSDIKEHLFKLDMIFYKVYELTYKEVKIVDPAFNLTEEEYDNYEIN